MRVGRPLRKSLGGLWLPDTTTTSAGRYSFTRVFAPHDAVFPGLPNDFGEFKRLVRALSRTDTLLWCARMNLHLGHPLQDDPKDVQKHFVASFFSGEEVARLNRFVREYGEDVSVFFRGQLLELTRWVALLSTDQSEDGTTFNDPAVRHCFARAALLAGDVWGRRIYPDDLQVEGGVDATRRRILAMLRQSNIETSAGPHPLLAFARGVSVGEHLLRRMPEADGDLQRAIGLTFEDYFSITAYVAAMSLRHSIADFKTPEKSGMLPLGSIEEATTPLGRRLHSYLSHEAQSPDELRRALWQDRTDSEESAGGRFLFTPLRAKPLLKARGDRAVIIDPTLFAERPTAGPLFHLARGKQGGQANRLFAAFGDAFEDYVRDVMRRIFREADDTPLARRYIHNPKAVDRRGNEVELADGLLLEHDVAVLLEVKAVWIREDLSSPDTDPGRYIEHLRERYGVSAQSKPGDRPVKGLGQLARAIKGLSEGTLVPVDATFAGVRRLLPILLVHDAHLNAGAHPHFLAEEFASALGRDEIPERWREIQIGPFQVAHLLVLTVEDIELLETSSDHFSVVTGFNEYASRSPDRMTSFYNFLVTSEFREKLRYSRWLESKRDELLDHAVEHLASEGSS